MLLKPVLPVEMMLRGVDGTRETGYSAGKGCRASASGLPRCSSEQLEARQSAPVQYGLVDAGDDFQRDQWTDDWRERDRGVHDRHVQARHLREQ